MAKDLVEAMVAGDGRLAPEIALERGWQQNSDEAALRAVIDRLVTANPEQVHRGGALPAQVRASRRRSGRSLRGTARDGLGRVGLAEHQAAAVQSGREPPQVGALTAGHPARCPCGLVGRVGLAEHQAAAVQSGRDRVFAWFVGQVMKATRGQANPALAAQLLRERMRV